MIRALEMAFRNPVYNAAYFLVCSFIFFFRSRNKKQKVSSEINSLAEKTFFKGHKRHQAFENHKNWEKKF
jgi:hypothetical protein